MKPESESHESEHEPPEDPVRIRNLLLVTVLLTIFHFGVYQGIAQTELLSGAKFEWAKVGAAVGSGPEPKAERDLATGLKEGLLRLPLLVIVDRAPRTSYYHMLEVPLGLRALNSLAAAILLHMLGLVVVQILPQEHRFRRFFEGRGLREKGALPRQLDKVPLFQLARQFEEWEEKRFGTVMIIAFFHLCLTQAAEIVSIGARLNLSGKPAPNPFMVIMRLPLTPLFISPEFWERRFAYAGTPGIVKLANSAIFAIVAIIVHRLVRRRH